MWDAALVARVRDRKLNEILIFASMAKVDTGRIDEYIDIIVSLGDDIDACDTLLDTDGEAEIVLDAIRSREYVSRLTPSEAEDEAAFNGMKSEPADPGEEMGCSDAEYVRSLIEEAVETIIGERAPARDEADEDLREAFHNVLTELNEARVRIHQLETQNVEISEITADGIEHARQMAAMEDVVNELREKLAASERRADDQGRELESLRGSHLEVETELQQLRRDSEVLSDEARELASSKLFLTSELEASRARVSELEAECAKRGDDVKSLGAQVVGLTNELESSKSRTSELEAVCDDARQSLAKAESALADAETRNSELSSEVQRLSGANAELSARSDELAQERDDARSETEKAKEELESAAGEASRMSSRIAELEASLSEAGAESEALRERAARLESEAAEMADALSRRESEARGLVRENGSLESSVAELREQLAASERETDLLRVGSNALSAERDRLASELSAAAKAGEDAEALKEALSALKDELRTVRQRNEELSKELDYCKEAVATAESERDEAYAARDAALSAPAPEPEVVDTPESVAEPVPEPAAEPVVEAAPEPAPVKESEPARPSGPAVDRILTEQEVEDLKAIVAMKDRKIDEFIDRSMDGRMPEDVCDDIVTFLKVDGDICRSLLGIDCTDMDSIVAGFRSILDTLQEAPDSRYQKKYLSTLSREERQLEGRYVQIIDKMHGIISSRYMRFM